MDIILYRHKNSFKAKSVDKLCIKNLNTITSMYEAQLNVNI